MFRSIYSLNVNALTWFTYTLASCDNTPPIHQLACQPIASTRRYGWDPRGTAGRAPSAPTSAGLSATLEMPAACSSLRRHRLTLQKVGNKLPTVLCLHHTVGNLFPSGDNRAVHWCVCLHSAAHCQHLQAPVCGAWTGLLQPRLGRQLMLPGGAGSPAQRAGAARLPCDKVSRLHARTGLQEGCTGLALPLHSVRP